MVMDICEDGFMRPFRKRAVSGHALSRVGVDIRSFPDIIPVSFSPSEQDHIKAVSLIIFRLGAVLNNVEPLCGLLARIREEHVHMLFQPFKILSCVDDLASVRGVLFYP